MGFIVKGVALGPKRSSGFTLGCLELESDVLAKEVDFFELDFEVLYSPDRDAYIIGVAMVVVCDDC